VGAGDCVTANLAAALAAGASLREALQLANAAASVVVHKLGTTGTASVAEIKGLLYAQALDEGLTKLAAEIWDEDDRRVPPTHPAR
jgi:bifunctional ADP-heptose synthase (sugar kinase/adenylyltransferase)